MIVSEEPMFSNFAEIYWNTSMLEKKTIHTLASNGRVGNLGLKEFLKCDSYALTKIIGRLRDKNYVDSDIDYISKRWSLTEQGRRAHDVLKYGYDNYLHTPDSSLDGTKMYFVLPDYIDWLRENNLFSKRLKEKPNSAVRIIDRLIFSPSDRNGFTALMQAGNALYNTALEQLSTMESIGLVESHKGKNMIRKYYKMKDSEATRSLYKTIRLPEMFARNSFA